MKVVKSVFLYLLFLVALPSVVAQDFRLQPANEGLTLSAEVGAIGSRGTAAPFWTIHGQGGRRSFAPNKVWTELYASYYHRLGEIHQLGAVVELDVESGLKPKYRLRQAGVMYELPYVGLKLGAFQYRQPINYSPQTSGAMVLSNNAAPIPMAMLYTNGFLDFPWTKGLFSFYIDFSLGRFFEDKFHELTYPDALKGSYTHGTLWHHKTGYLRFGKSEAAVPLVLTLGGTHAAHWGGRHYLFEEPEPSSFKDFLRVVLGKSGGEDATVSDQINVLGNHYGQYLVQLEWFAPRGTWQLYYQKVFEDKSGIEWNNGPDGLWGIHYTLKSDNAWVKHLVAELLTTMDQSGPFHILSFHRPNGEGRGGGGDNYYYNGEYRSGANHLGMRIGHPLLITPLYGEYMGEGEPFYESTRVQALHFGLGGTIRPLAGLRYEAKLTLARSYGTFSRRLSPPRKSTYTYLRMELPLPQYPQLCIGAELGADMGEYTPRSLGGALSVRYTFNRPQF